jgi:hypothetical protein
MMSRGITYLGLIGTLRHEELLREAEQRRRFSAESIRRREDRGFASIWQAFRARKR